METRLDAALTALEDFQTAFAALMEDTDLTREQLMSLGTTFGQVPVCLSTWRNQLETAKRLAEPSAVPVMPEAVE